MNTINEKNIVEVAAEAVQFNILIAAAQNVAAQKTGLANFLSSETELTVFPPTDAAFETSLNHLGVKGINELSAEQLTPILTYHVVPGKVMSTDLSNTSVENLNSQKIKIDLTEGVKINESKVVAADIAVKNGVIHVIDKVLIPEAKATSSKGSGCAN